MSRTRRLVLAVGTLGAAAWCGCAPDLYVAERAELDTTGTMAPSRAEPVDPSACDALVALWDAADTLAASDDVEAAADALVARGDEVKAVWPGLGFFVDVQVEMQIRRRREVLTPQDDLEGLEAKLVIDDAWSRRCERP